MGPDALQGKKRAVACPAIAALVACWKILVLYVPDLHNVMGETRPLSFKREVQQKPTEALLRREPAGGCTALLLSSASAQDKGVEKVPRNYREPSKELTRAKDKRKRAESADRESLVRDSGLW